MPPQIISAKDYGYRKVIRVCMDPDAPESVHDDGNAHTGNPPPGTAPGLKPWEWCHDCRYNWDGREFLWTDAELYITPGGGSRRLKTNQELLDEITFRLLPAATASQISELIDLSVG